MIQFMPLRWILDTRHLSPDVKGSIAEPSVMLGFQQVAAYSEQVIDRTVGGEKSLCVTWRFESPHLPLSLPGRLMRVFRPIIFPFVLPVHDARHNLFLCCAVASQFVRYNGPR